MNTEIQSMALRVVRFLFLLVVSWIVMTFTHESGHIVGGKCCGGSLQSADLLPWHLPYSIFQPAPLPLVTLWAGLILGVLVPVVFALIIRRDWMWFIANFCLIANGTYVATAWWSGDRHLDTPKLIEHGASPITIALYCVVTIGLGFVGFRMSCVAALLPSMKHLPCQD
jgi:hypothetical protein